MGNRIGKREAYRQAINMAAAMVSDADFYYLFGELCEGDLSEDDEQVLHEAQGKAVARILSLIRAKP